ncbi:MAG: hypothetical protein V3U84_09460, partial [Thiotrichaceae bacterium]
VLRPPIIIKKQGESKMSEEQISPENILTVEALLKKGLDIKFPVSTSMGIFEVRPLSLGEQSEVKALEQRGVSVKASGSNKRKGEDIGPDSTEAIVNNELMVKGQEEAKMTRVAYGLSVDKKRYTAETIKKLKLPRMIFEDVNAQIKTISEVGEPIVKPFLIHDSGAENGNADTEREPDSVDHRGDDGGPS